MDETYLTVAEIAKLLKINPQTVPNWIDRGELPAMHVGRRVRVKRSDFCRFIEQSYVNGPPKPASPNIWEGEIPQPVGPEAQ